MDSNTESNIEVVFGSGWQPNKRERFSLRAPLNTIITTLKLMLLSTVRPIVGLFTNQADPQYLEGRSSKRRRLTYETSFEPDNLVFRARHRPLHDHQTVADIPRNRDLVRQINAYSNNKTAPIPADMTAANDFQTALHYIWTNYEIQVYKQQGPPRPRGLKRWHLVRQQFLHQMMNLMSQSNDVIGFVFRVYDHSLDGCYEVYARHFGCGIYQVRGDMESMTRMIAFDGCSTFRTISYSEHGQLEIEPVDIEDVLNAYENEIIPRAHFYTHIGQVFAQLGDNLALPYDIVRAILQNHRNLERWPGHDRVSRMMGVKEDGGGSNCVFALDHMTQLLGPIPSPWSVDEQEFQPRTQHGNRLKRKLER